MEPGSMSGLVPVDPAAIIGHWETKQHVVMSFSGARSGRWDQEEALGVIPGQVTGYSKASFMQEEIIGFQAGKIAFVCQLFYLKKPPPL